VPHSRTTKKTTFFVRFPSKNDWHSGGSKTAFDLCVRSNKAQMTTRCNWHTDACRFFLWQVLLWNRKRFLPVGEGKLFRGIGPEIVLSPNGWCSSEFSNPQQDVISTTKHTSNPGMLIRAGRRAPVRVDFPQGGRGLKTGRIPNFCPTSDPV